MKEIRTIIIDDSSMTRRILYTELNKDPGIKVIGTARDAVSGRDKIVYLNPDVVILDIKMPGINGLSLLKQIMQYKPVPVIIMSRFAGQGNLALKAMELGASEVISKPGEKYPISDMKEQLIEKIKAVARIKTKEKLSLTHELHNQLLMSKDSFSKDKIIAIGASTGGTSAIKEVLMKLPSNMPPIVIVQHMPEDFTHSFALHLNEMCALKVVEANDNDLLEAGKVLLAPGNKHMILKKSDGSYKVELRDGPLVYFQRPSVEVLFNSVAKVVKNKAIGVILTGMGKDGAYGLLKMKNAGAYTIGQDKKSSTVYGMPKEAFKIGAVMKQLPLDQIPEFLIYLSKKERKHLNL